MFGQGPSLHVPQMQYILFTLISTLYKKDDNDSFDPPSKTCTSQSAKAQCATSPTPESQGGHNTQRKLR